MATFQARVKQMMKTADLTVFDLHTWFDRPYPTVWTWVEEGHEPGRRSQSKKRSKSGDKAFEDLELLEKAVRLKLFPLPPASQRLRRTYVRDRYNAAIRARLPQAHSPK